MKALKQLNKSQNFVLAVVMWEFFSYFGMRALLILYLTQKLTFNDQHAYAIYGAFTSMIFVTPILGGWLADRYLGFKRAVIIGASLIILGHAVLSLLPDNYLMLGLSILICGVGFFKANAICLVSDCYRDKPDEKSIGFVLYYVGANIGATLGPLVCAYLSQKYNYSIAFAAAGIGMAIGLSILFLGRKQLSNYGNPTSESPKSKQFIVYLLLACLALITLFTFVLKNNLAIYVLIAVLLLSALWVYKIFSSANAPTRKNLFWILILTLFATAFWVFDMQSGSSISLFIERNIQRNGIPTAMFQSINPAIILIGGLILAWVWRVLNRKKREPSSFPKMIIGFLLLTIGFIAVDLSAWQAQTKGFASMLGPVFGLGVIGLAELFIDPVVLAKLNKTPIKNCNSVLTGVYYVFVGAIANYVAAKFASLTSIPKNILHDASPQLSAAIYSHVFFKFVVIGLLLISILTIIWLVRKSTGKLIGIEK